MKPLCKKTQGDTKKKKKKTKQRKRELINKGKDSQDVIKQRTTKISKHLVSRIIHIFKCPPITLPPYTPYQAQ